MIDLDKSKNYLFDLDYLSMTTVKGEKAREFLQGQLSADMKLVNESTMQMAAYCSLKGRVLALIDVIDWPNLPNVQNTPNSPNLHAQASQNISSLQMIMPKNISESILRSLSKTALLSRVSLHTHSDIKIFGLYLNDRDECVLPPLLSHLLVATKSYMSNDKLAAYSIGDNFYILLLPSQSSEDICSAFSKSKRLLAYSEWHALQLQRLRFEIYPHTQNLFLPHRLMLHKKDYLSFEKGCYKGQEIIARMHYRSTLKHDLKLFRIQSPHTPTAGNKLFAVDGRTEVGELVDFISETRSIFTSEASTNYLILVSILHAHPDEILIEGASIPVVLSRF